MRQIETMEAYLDDYGLIVVYIHETFYQGKSESFRLKSADGHQYDLNIRSINRSNSVYMKYKLAAPMNLVIGQDYTIVADYALTCPLRYGYIVRSKRFDEEFAYDKDDLGIHYTPTKTSFTVWAPTATQILVELHKGEHFIQTRLNRSEKGVFRGCVNQDVEGYRYHYLVHVNGQWNQAIDPYGMACDANKREGFIIDEMKLDMEMYDGIPPVLESYTDAIIYEAHVRDFTKQFYNDAYAGKFLGMVQEGLRTPNGNSAGFDYLKQLGVTHVQFLPIADFATVDEECMDRYYNWGYDPAHYNIPEGSYASNPNNPYSRLLECKTMISKIHQSGMRVIMDVVYNHMHSMVNSDFEKIVPHYYFRLSNDGEISNGSFCGNDFDSTRYMARKFICDSVAMWVKKYHVDGFRFDLMGILDIETVNQAYHIAHAINPNILMHGEGWNMPTLLPDEDKASLTNQEKMSRVAQFNDFFREHVKGKSNDGQLSIKGYCTGDSSYIYAIPACLSGTVMNREGYVRIFNNPEKSTNYVECHDNATVWDKMKMSNSGETGAMRIQRQKMMLGCVLLAQGIPFIHAGQEFCRSKQGVCNSYASSDLINRIDWDRKDKYEQVVKYTKDMIALRKAVPAFRLRTQQEIEQHIEFTYLNDSILEYHLKDISQYGMYDDIRVIINPNTTPQSYKVQEEYTRIANSNGFVRGESAKTSWLLEELSITVLVK